MYLYDMCIRMRRYVLLGMLPGLKKLPTSTELDILLQSELKFEVVLPTISIPHVSLI